MRTKKDSKAISYWWGLSADVVDVVYSTRIPIGTKRLVELLKDAIRSGHFDPFAGVLYSQSGIVQSDPQPFADTGRDCQHGLAGGECYWQYSDNR